MVRCFLGQLGDSDCREEYFSPCRHKCENSGQCYVEWRALDGSLSALCKCPSGYTGTQCQIDINECSSYPCQNGAKCVNTPGNVRSAQAGLLCTTTPASVHLLRSQSFNLHRVPPIKVCFLLCYRELLVPVHTGLQRRELPL